MKNDILVHNAILKALDVLQPSIEKTVESIEILLMVAAHESMGFKYNRQIGGPALSFFQIEPATHRDLYINYLRYRPELLKLVLDGVPPQKLVEIAEGIKAPVDSWLVDDVVYAAKIARVVLYRVPDKLPKLKRDERGQMSESFLIDLANYCKTHYNTVKGKATAMEYYQDYLAHCR